MFCGVSVNISPVRLTARGQSCNLRLSAACIQKTNKDVLSFCVCVCGCEWVRVMKRVKQRHGWRGSKGESKRDKDGQKGREVTLQDKPHCHCHGLMVWDAYSYGTAISVGFSTQCRWQNCAVCLWLCDCQATKCTFCSNEAYDIVKKKKNLHFFLKILSITRLLDTLLAWSPCLSYLSQINALC